MTTKDRIYTLTSDKEIIKYILAATACFAHLRYAKVRNLTKEQIDICVRDAVDSAAKRTKRTYDATYTLLEKYGIITPIWGMTEKEAQTILWRGRLELI